MSKSIIPTTNMVSFAWRGHHAPIAELIAASILPGIQAVATANDAEATCWTDGHVISAHASIKVEARFTIGFGAAGILIDLLFSRIGDRFASQRDGGALENCHGL